jgi:hypothetical protein
MCVYQELDCLARREEGLVAVTREVEEAANTVRECRECSPELAARLQVQIHVATRAANTVRECSPELAAMLEVQKVL